MRQRNTVLRDSVKMSGILDIEARLKELESILGQTVILVEQPEDEPACLPNDERSGVAQSREGKPSSTEATGDRATPQNAPTLSDSEELDEMGNCRDAAPFAHLKTQDLSHEDRPFCPWKVVKTYAECFTGKANRPRVTSSLVFDEVLSAN